MYNYKYSIYLCESNDKMKKWQDHVTSIIKHRWKPPFAFPSILPAFGFYIVDNVTGTYWKKYYKEHGCRFLCSKFDIRHFKVISCLSDNWTTLVKSQGALLSVHKWKWKWPVLPNGVPIFCIYGLLLVQIWQWLGIHAGVSFLVERPKLPRHFLWRYEHSWSRLQQLVVSWTAPSLTIIVCSSRATRKKGCLPLMG